MPPTPPSDSGTGKKASNPIAPRSRLSKTGSIARGSTSASASSLSSKTSNNAHTRSGSGGTRKPAGTAAGSILTTGSMGPPVGKRPVNEKFDNLFFKSPVPRAISKLLSNSQSASSTGNGSTVPSSLRRSIGASPSTSASATTASTTAAAGLKKARGVTTKRPATTTPESTGQTPKRPTKPTTAVTTTTAPGTNGTVPVNFTLPNDGQERTLPTPMDEPGDDDGEDIIPSRVSIKPTPKLRARANLRSSVIPGTPEKLPITTRTRPVRGANGKETKGARQAQKENAEKKAVESPKGVMRNTASSRARAAASSGAGAKSGTKAGEMQAGRTSAASVGTAAVAMAMPTTPAAPLPPRETRSSGLSSSFKSQVRDHINAWAEAQKKISPELGPEPAKEKDTEKGRAILPTPEVHIPIPARSSAAKKRNPPPPPPSPPKPKTVRKPHPSTLTPGFAVPPGILDETGSLWDSGRRKSRRSIGTPTSTTATTPITNARRRMTIASGSVVSTSAADANINGNGKRKSMGDTDVGPAGKKARVSDPEAAEAPNGGTVGGENRSKSVSAKRGKGGKGKEKVYVNTDFEFSDIEV
ncbi:unnamed protein product [Tuber aestivum]|uniref:Uncharacterized protein n=1 Tax=Tuber aestivum TaxID=59557 RepID=A0A292PXR8_9PEZI|nr:unnamed protein product [Tuber aestivum]